MSRVFILHGWAGRSDGDWIPWAIQKCKERGYQAVAPALPNPDHPDMEQWLSTLSQVIGTPQEDDILIGHSMGCQAILRYLERKNTKVKKVILIAGWMVLRDAAFDIPEDHEIARPWIELPINFEKVKTLSSQFVAFFSDDDPWVPLQENAAIFKKELGALILVEPHKGHFMKNIGEVETMPEILPYLSE